MITNKIYKKLTSVILMLAIVLSSFVTIHGDNNEDKKPNIKVSGPTFSPKKPQVGDEVEIKYLLEPQPFQHNISKPKEIVLVLDKSGSMDEKIEIKCEHNNSSNHYYYNLNNKKEICTHTSKNGIKTDYCIEHNKSGTHKINGKNCNLKKVDIYCTSHEIEVYKCNYGSKIEHLKVASKRFIDRMSSVENLKISIVEYSSKAKISENLKDVASEKQSLIDTIDEIDTGGGTNSGDALRRAGHILKNLGNKDAHKSIVFMSDGEPTFYTYITKNNQNYYYDILDNEDKKNNTRNDYDSGKIYAYKIADVIKDELSNINTFTIGYGLDKDGNKIMSEIHKKMGGQPQNFHPTSDSIDEIFNQIADDIIAQYKIEDQELDMNLDPSAPIIGDIEYGEIIYTRGEDGWYTAKPVEITFKVKCTKKGKITIIGEGSSFKYKDIFGNEVEVPINPLEINIQSDSKVTIEVNDSSGKIQNIYDSSESIANRYDKSILNEFEQEYKLFGASYADIKFEGSEVNYLQYQIIKSQDIPTKLPDDGWQEIYDGGGGIPGDIDPTKPGYLTQKSYDVSHMPHMTDNEKWKDRDLVFKNPFNESKEKPATITSSANNYVKKVEYQHYNSDTGKYETRYRWESNNIFCNNMNIGGDYKEANKTWGYIKVPKSGIYKFKTYSDDGMYAKLTVEGKEKVLVNNLTPHGSQASSEVSIELEKDKYYPIYIEYFNWGGWGHYELQYKPPGESSFKQIPSDCFYASSNTTPGEGGDNSFVGSGNIKIPEEVGKYYIAYRSGHKSKIFKTFELFKEGVYGPFNVDERFTLSRTIKENTEEGSLYDYILEYKLQPNDLRLTDLYKTKAQLDQANSSGSLKQDLSILNSKIIDTIPDKIRINSQQIGLNSTHIFKPSVEEYIQDGVYKGAKIDGFIQGDINYSLNKESNLYNSVYKSKPIILNLGVNTEDIGELEFNKESGVLLYKDVSLNNTGSNKEQNFPNYKFTVSGKNEIKDHGIYHQNRNKFEIGTNQQDVIEDMNYQVGVDIEVKRNNSTMKLEATDNVIDINSIKIYKHDGLGNLTEKLSNNNIKKSGNSIELVGLNKGNYVIVYVSSFKKDSSIDAILDKSRKTFNASLLGGDTINPEERLPELF